MKQRKETGKAKASAIRAVRRNPLSPIPQTGFEELAVSHSDSVNPVYPIGDAKHASQAKIVNYVYEIKKEPYPFRLSWSHYLVLMRIDNPTRKLCVA